MNSIMGTVARKLPIIVALSAVLFLAAFLRIRGIDYSFWYDEIASAAFAKVHLGQLWSDWIRIETNPPLYYTILGVWSKVISTSDIGMRSLSVVFGCFDIIIVFLLGRHIGGDRTGLIAALFTAISVPHIIFSQQVRAYILARIASDATVLFTTLFWSISHSEQYRLKCFFAVGYIIFCLLALYSHTTMILLPALINIYITLTIFAGSMRGRKTIWLWIAANTAVFFIWSWWLRITILQIGSGDNISWIRSPSISYAIRMMLEIYTPWGIGWVQYVISPIIILLALFGALKLRTKDECGILFAIAFGAPAMLYLISLKVPIYMPRTVFWAGGPFVVIVAFGIVTIARKWQQVSAVVMLFLASLSAYLLWFPHREIEQWKGIVRELNLTDYDANIIVKGKGVAMSLLHYCIKPECKIQVHYLAGGKADHWASEFHVLGSIKEKNMEDILKTSKREIVLRWLDDVPILPVRPCTEAQPILMPFRLTDSISLSLIREKTDCK